MRRGIQPGYQIPKSKCEPCLNLNNTRAWWQASGEKLVNQTMPMLCKCKVLNKLYEKEHLRNVYMKKKTGVTVKNEHTHTQNDIGTTIVYVIVYVAFRTVLIAFATSAVQTKKSSQNTVNMMLEF